MTLVRLAAALFLVLHGASHPLVWGFYHPDNWDPRHSWLLGDARAPVLVLAAATAASFVMAALALAFEASWWPSAAIAGVAPSVLLILLTFTIRWWAGLAIDVVVLALALRSLDS